MPCNLKAPVVRRVNISSRRTCCSCVSNSALSIFILVASFFELVFFFNAVISLSSLLIYALRSVIVAL